MIPEPHRPRCTSCESLYGIHDALPADVLCSSVLMPGKMIPLCAGHAVERGYIGTYGYPVGNHVNVVDLHTPQTCAACGYIDPN